jgi:hypothetical protein
MDKTKLIDAWLSAKRAERQATANRIAIENDILQWVELPEEGNIVIEDGENKMTITQKVNRKIDAMAIRQVFNEMPEGLCPVTWVEEPKLDITGYRWLRENEPGLFRLLSKAITEKPAKPAFTVKGDE